MPAALPPISLALAVFLIAYGAYALVPDWFPAGRGLSGRFSMDAPRCPGIALPQGIRVRTAVVTREGGVVWALFAIALALRLLFLGSIPNTATADELDFSRDLMAIFTGHGSGLFGLDWTPEPAFSVYLMAGSWKIFGMTLFAERLVSAILSALAVFPFYALARRAASLSAAALATALFVAARWYLLFSRSGWNNAHIVLYMLLAAWALTLALERRQYRYWAGFGAALAALAYGYFSGRAVIIAFAVYVPCVVWHRAHNGKPGQWLPLAVGTAIATGVCALLFAPEVPTILSNLSAFNSRTSSVYIFNQPLPPGESIPAVLLDQATKMLRSFVLMDGSFDGGTLGRYKAPDQGWLDSVSTLLYWVGLAVALRRARTYALWWCLFLIPLSITQLLTIGTPDGARALPAVALMYLFVALGIDRLLRLASRYRRVARPVALAAVIVVMALNVTDYVTWVDGPAQQQARQPAVPVDGFGRWRDFQLARLRSGQGSIPAGIYDTLSQAQIETQTIRPRLH